MQADSLPAELQGKEHKITATILLVPLSGLEEEPVPKEFIQSAEGVGVGIRKTNSVSLGQNQGVSKAVLPLEALGENPLHDVCQPLEKHLDSLACGSYHHQRQQENSFSSLSAVITLPSHFCCSHPFYKDTEDCS